MPTGFLINVGSVLLGGLIGGLVGNKLSEHFKAQLTMVLVCVRWGWNLFHCADEKYAGCYFCFSDRNSEIGLIVHLGNGINKGLR